MANDIPELITFQEALDIVTKTEVAEMTDGGDRRWSRRMAEALMEAANKKIKSTRTAPKVKPLPWGDYSGHACAVSLAAGVMGTYYIDREVKGYCLSLGSEKVGIFNTIKYSQIQAQADYERRILSALE